MADQRSIVRRQLDEALAAYPRAGRTAAPAGGWVRAIRQSLGITQAALSAQLGVTRQAVQELERAEAQRRITFDSLDRLARALGCELAYALVPKAGSLEATLTQRARTVADAMLARTAHTMALEKQSLTQRQLARRRTALVASLRDKQPGKLWK